MHFDSLSCTVPTNTPMAQVFHGTGEQHSIIQHGIVFVGVPAFFNILAVILSLNKVRCHCDRLLRMASQFVTPLRVHSCHVAASSR